MVHDEAGGPWFRASSVELAVMLLSDFEVRFPTFGAARLWFGLAWLDSAWLSVWLGFAR